jgi:serine/threonine protein kinase
MQNPPDVTALGVAVPAAASIEFLGEGGFKVAYRAVIEGRSEALKIIFVPPEENAPEAHAEIVGRVRREIEALAVIKCPYVVKLGSLAPHDCEIGPHHYVAYSEELLQGRSLREHIREGQRPSLKACAVLMRCLILAISEMKDNNLIHRDIKPDNIIALEDTARPYVLLDLGVAFKLHSTPITRNPDFRQGTLPYMAPEMFNPRFREILDFRSDLYSAAVTAYEYAAGVHPIARRREDDYTTMWRIARLVPESLAKHRPDLPDSFCRTVDQLMRKNPALRPAGIESLLRTLEAWL